MSSSREGGRTNTPASGISPAPSDCSDEELAGRAVYDEEAFVALYRRHVSGVYSYARWKVGPDDAEDITAETFMQALRGIGRFRGDSSFRTWLFGIARRTIAQHFRKRKGIASDEALDTPSGEDIESIHLAEERAQHLRDLVSRLRGSYREVIELHYWAGLRIREIAALLGKKESTIRVTMHRAVRQLGCMWRSED